MVQELPWAARDYSQDALGADLGTVRLVNLTCPLFRGLGAPVVATFRALWGRGWVSLEGFEKMPAPGQGHVHLACYVRDNGGLMCPEDQLHACLNAW